MAAQTHAVAEPVKKYAKHAFDHNPKGHKSFDEFLHHLSDPASSILPVELDTSHPLSHYFINSSHNTYLSGNQLWGRSTTDAYKEVLKRACRCIEVDIWDGGSPSSSEAEEAEPAKDSDVNHLSGLLKKGLGRLRSRSNVRRADTDLPATADTAMPTPWRTDSGRDEPVVYHGYTATSEMPFRKVCEVVRKYAFRTSDLPLIVSLEIHCHPPQQEIVVELMKDYWGDFLVRPPADFSDTTPLPPLGSLKVRVDSLIHLAVRCANIALEEDPRVKYSPPEKEKGGVEKKDPSKSGSDQDSAGEDAAEAKKKGKIIDALANMGVFTRARHFDHFDQPEAKIPTHVFSLSEKRLLAACKEEPGKVFEHNLNFLMRAYPKGTRVRSSNLDAASLWRAGLQMVALNFQSLNAATMCNVAQFEGTGGYVLKPPGYLPTGKQQIPPERVAINLRIKLLAAQALGPENDIPNAYVKCELHVESKAEAEEGTIPHGGKDTGDEWKRRSFVRRSRDPDWSGEELAFEGVQRVMPQLTFVRIKVMDDTLLASKDRLLGWCCYRLDRLPQGLLFVNLRGEDTKPISSKLLFQVQKEVLPALASKTDQRSPRMK